MNNKQKDKKQMDKQKSLKHLQELRQFFKKEAQKAINQIKENQMLSLDEIREAQALFDDVEQTNQYLRVKNQEKRKQMAGKQRKGEENKTGNISQKKNKQKHKQKEMDKSKQKDKDKEKEKEEGIDRDKMQDINQDKSKDKNKSNAKSKDKSKAKTRDKKLQQKKENERKETIKKGIIDEPLYPIFDENRRWDQILQNPKTGRFQTQQKRLLTQSLSQYLVRNNIELSTLHEILQGQNTLIPRNKRMWTAICSVLPNRTLRSTYRYLVRMLRRDSVRKWEPRDEEELMDLYKRYGGKWKIIGRALGRSGENVRDKYRNMVRKEGTSMWKIQQLVLLSQLIQQQSGHKFIKQGIQSLLEQAEQHNQKQAESRNICKYNSKHAITPNIMRLLEYIQASELGRVRRHTIPWKHISQSLESRTELQCKNKYLQLMQILNKDRSGESEHKVIEFIERQYVRGRDRDPGFTCCDIRWERWNGEMTEMSEEEARCQWRMMRKKVGNRGDKSFGEVLEEIKKANQRKREKYRDREWAELTNNNNTFEPIIVIEEEVAPVYENSKKKKQKQKKDTKQNAMQLKKSNLDFMNKK